MRLLMSSLVLNISNLSSCMELFSPRCRTCPFPLLNFVRFQFSHFSNVLRSL